MPITSSAKKALRQSKKHAESNALKKEAFRTVIKNFKKFIAAKNIKDAADLLPSIYQKLDKAAKTHVIKKNTASRLKSRLAAKVAAK